MVISVRGSLGEAYIVHVLNVFWNLEVTDLHGGFYPDGSFERSKAFSYLQQPYKKWSAFGCFCAAVSESRKMRRERKGASTICPLVLGENTAMQSAREHGTHLIWGSWTPGG